MLFSAGMVTAFVAPTDFGTDLSTIGYIHRYASMAAFIALPLAALMYDHATRAVKWTVAVTTGFMLAMLASATIGDRVLIGLAERLLLGAELVLLGLLATGLWRDLGGTVRLRDTSTG